MFSLGNQSHVAGTLRITSAISWKGLLGHGLVVLMASWLLAAADHRLHGDGVDVLVGRTTADNRHVSRQRDILFDCDLHC